MLDEINNSKRLQEAMKLGQFRIRNYVVEQRDYRIPEDIAILELVRTGKLDCNTLGDTVTILSYNGQLFELNLVAAIIWDCLKYGSVNVDNIVKELISIFNESESILADVSEFIQVLCENNLIELDR